MSSLNQLHAPRSSRHRRKRVGRGQGSGLGKTAGRGGKGQKARTGNMHFEGFEGGQMPLQRRLPKFGFTSPNRIRYAIVNLGELERFDAGTVVDEAVLREAGLLKGQFDALKILGNGAISRALTVKAHKFSQRARDSIRGAGGTPEDLPLVVHRPESAAKAHAGKGVRAEAAPKA